MKFVVRFMSVAVFAAIISVSSAHALTIVLGHSKDPSSEAASVVYQTILERMGYNVSIRKGPASLMFPVIAEGKMDLFVAASLPNEHASDWEEYKDDLVLLTPIYEDARMFWAVPDYVPASAVSSIADLAKPEVAARMEKSIRAPSSRSELIDRSQKVVQEYGLAQAGYQFSAAKEADWAEKFNAGLKSEKWFVVPLWQPHYVNKVAKLRILEEPRKLLGKPDTIWLVARKGTKQKIGRTGYGVLQKMEMSLKWITELEYEVRVEKRAPRDAARRWMGMHPYTVEYWVEPEED